MFKSVYYTKVKHELAVQIEEKKSCYCLGKNKGSKIYNSMIKCIKFIIANLLPLSIMASFKCNICDQD